MHGILEVNFILEKKNEIVKSYVSCLLYSYSHRSPLCQVTPKEKRRKRKKKDILEVIYSSIKVIYRIKHNEIT